METQHPNNVVDLMLFQLYCHVASNPNGNAASRRLSTRPDDLTQVLVVLGGSSRTQCGQGCHRLCSSPASHASLRHPPEALAAHPSSVPRGPKQATHNWTIGCIAPPTSMDFPAHGHMNQEEPHVPRTTASHVHSISGGTTCPSARLRTVHCSMHLLRRPARLLWMPATKLRYNGVVRVKSL